MASPPRSLFVNLSVQEVSASTVFFRTLGFGFDFAERFTTSPACMVVSGQA